MHAGRQEIADFVLEGGLEPLQPRRQQRGAVVHGPLHLWVHHDRVDDLGVDRPLHSRVSEDRLAARDEHSVFTTCRRVHNDVLDSTKGLE